MLCLSRRLLFQWLPEIVSFTSGVFPVHLLKLLPSKSQKVSNEENIRSCVGGDSFFFEMIQALTKKCVYDGFAKQA